MEQYKITLLIVDDQPQNLQLLKSFLNDAGWNVVIASSGKSALKRAVITKPDLALFDIRMPEMDGFELCRRFKENPDLADIPVLFVTAANDNDSISMGFEVGAVDYISKPIRKRELLARVRNHLDLASLQRRLKQQVELKSRELNKSEERLKIAIEGTQDGLWDWDMKDNSAYFSDRFETMLGYEQGELPPTGDAWSGLLHPDDKEEAFLRLQEYLSGGKEHYISQFRMRTKDGKYRWIEGRGKAIFSEEGEALRIIGFNQDITLQKEAEIALKKSEDKFHKLFERSRNAIFLLDRYTGKYLDANQSAAHLTGRSIEEIKSLYTKDITPRDFQQRLEMVKSDTESLEFGEIYYKQPDGSEKVALVNLVSIDKNQVFGIAQDITPLKRALEKAEESNARVLSIIENTMASIWAVNKDYHLIYANQVFLNDFKSILNRELKVGDIILDKIPEEWKKSWKKRFQQVFNGENQSFEENYTRLDGKEYQIQYRLHPIEQDGQCYGVSVFSTDMTEQNRNEAILQRMEKLESIGTLAGGIAHDFNNLLTAFFGNVSLAKMSGKLDDETYGYLDDAEKSLERATALTRQLLTFSKGGMPQKELLQLEDLFKEIIALDLSGSNVKAVLEVDPQLWNVLGDKGQLQQVFSNLILNALQAMPDGGELQISLANRYRSIKKKSRQSKEPFLEIMIRDQGFGIPKEMMGKIFDPYFTTKEKGTGLGLATSYSIIQKHGGQITVDSQVGEGTVFSLLLPATKNKKQPIESEEILLTERKSVLHENHQVLLLDDEPAVADTAEKILKKLGFSVKTVHRGEEAILEYRRSLKNSTPYTLVILDLTIPGGMGGVKAIREILTDDPQANCFVSSGYYSDPVLANYNDYGFKGKILKPFTFSTMKEGLNL